MCIYMQVKYASVKDHESACPLGPEDTHPHTKEKKNSSSLIPTSLCPEQWWGSASTAASRHVFFDPVVFTLSLMVTSATRACNRPNVKRIHPAVRPARLKENKIHFHIKQPYNFTPLPPCKYCVWINDLVTVTERIEYEKKKSNQGFKFSKYCLIKYFSNLYLLKHNPRVTLTDVQLLV